MFNSQSFMNLSYRDFYNVSSYFTKAQVCFDKTESLLSDLSDENKNTNENLSDYTIAILYKTIDKLSIFMNECSDFLCLIEEHEQLIDKIIKIENYIFDYNHDSTGDKFVHFLDDLDDRKDILSRISTNEFNINKCLTYIKENVFIIE